MGFELKEFNMAVTYSAYSPSPPCSTEPKMEIEIEKIESLQEEKEPKMGIESLEEKKDGFLLNVGEEEDDQCRESNFSSDFLVSTVNGEEHSGHSSSSGSSEEDSSSQNIDDVANCGSSLECVVKDPHLKLEKQRSSLSEIEMMKERFAKLLLGEDMSGCGNGVGAALAISNAITNLCATLFGQIWRLEPLPPEKKTMWRREMDCLLCVSDHIVELAPSWQTLADGSKLEIMTSRPRSDIYVNLPALRKLDNMLLEILDSFVDTEFWYIDQGIIAPDADGSPTICRSLPRQVEKWWLPVPRVPQGGISENSRKQLQYRRDCTNQILKAAMAINSVTLVDMEVPDSYFESLPKNGKANLGDLIYRYITSEQFSPECLLDCLDLSSEHQALEIANRVEASIYMWRRKNSSKPMNKYSRSSWEMMKDLVIDGDKRELLADRAETLLVCLKQRFPGLPQTALDMSKIQCNKDVGKSILESYSRVLESLAFNIVARIDDLFYIDDLTKHSDQSTPISRVGLVTHKNINVPYSPMSILKTPYKTAFTTPNFSPNRGQKSPYIDIVKLQPRGFGVKKILTDYLTVDGKSKDSSDKISTTDSLSSDQEASNTCTEIVSSECSNEATCSPAGAINDAVWEE